jgi:SAM-dependent methyltransferase
MLASEVFEAGSRDSETENAIRAFYSQNPFPSHDELDSVGTLMAKARRGVYADMLDKQLPQSSSILECGCGTGQLSTFLSICGRKCLGVDLSMASLRCAEQFRNRENLPNVAFVQANLFDLPIGPETFDVVITKGVLHCTPDPRRAFRSVVERTRIGGHVIVGLYNRFGRVPSWLRKQRYRLMRRGSKGHDHVMRNAIKSEEKRRIWWEDQYNVPHESWHSVDEVLGWFRETGVEFVNAVPPITLASDHSPQRNLFEPTPVGGRFEHLLVQLGWMFTIAREGALFDLIGRRVARAPAAHGGDLR